MNAEQMRMAIAEASGWTEIRKCTCPQPCGKSPSGREGHLPDFLNDLNAMHEAESSLSDSEMDKYIMTLRYVVCGEHWIDKLSHRADAQQRAEAFLRTLGLWEDDPTP